MKCKSCKSGTEWSTIHRFCGECGAKLPAPAPEPVPSEGERLALQLLEAGKLTPAAYALGKRDGRREAFREAASFIRASFFGEGFEIAARECDALAAACGPAKAAATKELRDKVVDLTEALSISRRWCDEARQQRDANAKAAEALRGELTVSESSLAELRAKLAIVETDTDGVWRWMGAGDEPESLGCPVVMSAEKMREFAKAAGELEEARSLARSNHQQHAHYTGSCEKCRRFSAILFESDDQPTAQPTTETKGTTP